MQIHPVIVDALKHQIPATISYGAESQYGDFREFLFYNIDGFYKSGTILLCENEHGELMAHCRYGEKVAINSFHDLLELNLSWLKKSCQTTWGKPDDLWVNHLLNAGLIERDVETLVTYKY